MKCLKCDNDALAGKALCAACFSIHQARTEKLDSEEWINRKLKETRAKARERQHSDEKPSFKAELQNTFVRVAPVLIGMGALVIFASWFFQSGGFRFVRYKPAGVVQQAALPTSISKMGTEGVEKIADQAVVAADVVPTPVDSAESGGDGQRGWSAQIDTPTPTPTETPTNTPTNTPTITPTPA
jgi:hypothetical protein